jgi:hypothetical protein
MTEDPLDAMTARWSYIQGSLFPWMREDNDPITEALGRLVTTLDVIGLEAFVPEPPRGPGRPPEDRRAPARARQMTADYLAQLLDAVIAEVEALRAPTAQRAHQHARALRALQDIKRELAGRPLANTTATTGVSL